MGRWRLLVVGVLAVLAFPAQALASHSWSSYHWSAESYPLALTVSETVDSSYSPAGVRADWGASTKLSPVLADSGVIKVRSKSFGNNGWLGQAQIWVQGDHITRAEIKLNDFYYKFYSSIDREDVRRQVYCQEFGHVLGEAHRTEAGTCMNDQNDLTNVATTYPSPDNHDIGGGKGGPPCSKKPDHPNCQERGPITIDVFPAPFVFPGR
jgi:hypothetical protein